MLMCHPQTMQEASCLISGDEALDLSEWHKHSGQIGTYSVFQTCPMDGEGGKGGWHCVWHAMLDMNRTLTPCSSAGLAQCFLTRFAWLPEQETRSHLAAMKLIIGLMCTLQLRQQGPIRSRDGALQQTDFAGVCHTVCLHFQQHLYPTAALHVLHFHPSQQLTWHLSCLPSAVASRKELR